eukprot:jgi/Hompol1/5802/HPOL_001927-RA
MPGTGSLVITTSETADYTFSVEYDIFLVFVSYWTAVLGSYTGIQVFNQLVEVFRIYIGINVTELMTNPPRISNKFLRDSYIYFFINSKIIISLFLIAIALGGCGIWGMHFLGMHALRLYVVPKVQNSTYPTFDPYTEMVTQNYSLIIPIYYNGYQTFLSLVIPIAAVFIGMLVSGFGAGLIHTKTDARSLPKIMADFKAQAESRIRNSRALSMSERGMQSMAGHSSMAGRESMIGRESMAHRDSLNARDPLQSSIRPMSPTDTGTGAQTGTSDGGDVGQAINLAKANFFKLTLIRQLYFILGASIT